MGVDCETFAAYGVIVKVLPRRRGLGEDVEEAGFEMSRENCYTESSPAFFYIPETRISFDNRALKIIADPMSDEQDESNAACVGAVIEIPCPSRAQCEELIAFLKRQGIVQTDKTITVKPQVFSSIC
jgi:hypothetical protein